MHKNHYWIFCWVCVASIVSAVRVAATAVPWTNCVIKRKEKNKQTQTLAQNESERIVIRFCWKRFILLSNWIVYLTSQFFVSISFSEWKRVHTLWMVLRFSRSKSVCMVCHSFKELFSLRLCVNWWMGLSLNDGKDGISVVSQWPAITYETI